MKELMEQTKSENRLVKEADLVTTALLSDLHLTEFQTEQVKGGPSHGRDLLIGGMGSDEAQSASSRHVGGVNVCLGDGSVKFIK